MGETVITVEHISKLYQLGQIGTGTLRNDLNRWWAKVRGKEDPFTKIGEVSDRTVKGTSEYAWALKDINFEVKKGEILGIIGSNGAGKSTLLKTLSEITAPTEGRIKVKGLIASLLEVGTGFHPELTGRENIFLNGAILGMTKQEIKQKLDEIVAFAGVERYIDTPVKRYSSGMYVRLAFAVAAHLEPEILVIDEVLAVGDADFQKKCLGKMKEVSQGEGRTILFVSHNMQAIKNLCNKALWLKNGSIQDEGEVNAVINKYLAGEQNQQLSLLWEDPHTAPGNEKVRIRKMEVIPQLTPTLETFDIRVPIKVHVEFWNYLKAADLNIDLTLFSYGGDCIFAVSSEVLHCNEGLVKGTCHIPGNLLNNGSYYFGVCISKDTTTTSYENYEMLAIEIEDYRGNMRYFGKWHGAIRPKFPFAIEQVHAVSAG